ncbi:MAG: hypothetical protein R6U96_13140, partial [Promethearchaeia archaeon]
LIANLLNRIQQLTEDISQLVEDGIVSRAFSLVNELRSELRQLDNFISKRESISVHSHVLSEEQREQVGENEISAELVKELMEPVYTNGEKSEALREVVLNFHSKIKQDESKAKKEGVTHPVSENIPLYDLYQLILDERPQLHFSIEDLEDTINSLADEGYIPGIRIIQSDEDHYLKVVQFEAHDYSKKELQLISKALELEKFGLTDMVGALGWSTDQVRKTLAHLTEIGILKYSKSFLHGDRWYIVTQKAP